MKFPHIALVEGCYYKHARLRAVDVSTVAVDR
jgi:hypothetical protein